MTPARQIALITVGCCAVYFGLRSLPVEKCEFLHYGDYINAEGVVEGCGYEETDFFVMSEIRFPIIAQLTPLTEVGAGRPAQFQLTLFTTTGKPIRWEEIAVSHTERIHAMAVDPSLSDYQHLHPQPAGPAGHYLLELTPRRAGDYAVFLDFIPLVNSRRTLLATGFTVPGEAGAPAAGDRRTHRDGNLTFRFIGSGAPVAAGTEARFRLRVEADGGAPLAFSPVMDSYAHVVAFDSAGTGFAHLHPQNPFTEGQDPADPDLEFVFLFKDPGHYRVWAQVIIDGREIFAPFDLMVGGPANAVAVLP
jgi:hypothetical protein